MNGKIEVADAFISGVEFNKYTQLAKIALIKEEVTDLEYYENHTNKKEKEFEIHGTSQNTENSETKANVHDDHELHKKGTISRENTIKEEVLDSDDQYSEPNKEFEKNESTAIKQHADLEGGEIKMNVHVDHECQSHEYAYSKKFPNSCDICGQGFTYHWVMLYHRNTHFNKSDFHGNIRPLQRSSEFEDKNLEFHVDDENSVGEEILDSVTMKEIQIHNTSESQFESSQQGARSEVFVCKICNDWCTSKTGFQNHMQLHYGSTDLEDKLKNSVQNSTLANYALRNNRKRQYQCSVCHLSFANYTRCAEHESIHSEDHPYECEICKIRFMHPSKLLQHRKSHDNNLSLVCKICGRSLTSPSNLQSHMRSHTGEKPYRCTVCGKHFALASTLKSHILIHTDLRPYQCRVCQRSFTNYSTWAKHERIHTGERPYSCDICGKSFTQSGNMLRHKKSHDKR